MAVQKYEYEEYTPLTFVPADGFLAVWAVTDEETGEVRLETTELVGFGIATSTLHFMAKEVSESGDMQRVWETRDAISSNEVVYFDLSEGGIELCNECENFCGIIRAGERPETATWYMDSKYRDALKPE